jgi:hypothetical protein
MLPFGKQQESYCFLALTDPERVCLSAIVALFQDLPITSILAARVSRQ